MPRLCRKKHEEVRSVGGQFVPVYNSDVDEKKMDSLLRDFCLAHYSDADNSYVIANEYLPAKGKFLGLLYLMLQKKGIVFNGDNVTPFCSKLKLLLVDSKYTVDRSGLTRAKNALLEDEALLTMTSLDCTQTFNDYQEEIRDMYKKLRREWDNFANLHTESSSLAH